MVGSTAATATAVQCVLDRAVVNPDTIRKFTNLGLSIFAVLCGKNRGVFVDQQKDPGNTYSCLTLPPSFQSLVSDPTVSMSTSNDIGTLVEFELNLEQRGFHGALLFLTLVAITPIGYHFHRLAVPSGEHYW